MSSMPRDLSETKAARGRGLFVVADLMTSAGLMAGCLSLASAFDGRFELSALMIGISIACDSLDGLIARASRTASRFGIEYDSLSDVVAFGVAPASLVYTWALKPLGLWAVLIMGLFVICAALRLARFNLQAGTSAGKTRFVGLPVPGAAAVIAGILFGYRYFGLNSPRALCALMIAVTLVLAGVMVSRIPYPALKSVDLRAKKLEIGFTIVIAAILLLLAPRLAAFLAGAAYLVSGPALALSGEHIEEASSEGHAVGGKQGDVAPQS